MTLQELFEEYMKYPAFSTTALSDVNQRGDFNDPPIHLAASRGVVEELQILIDNGADIEARGDMCSKSTPLHIAALMGRLEAIKLLLKYGADPFAKDIDGERPLDIARWKEKSEPSDNHFEIVRILEGYKKGKI